MADERQKQITRLAVDLQELERSLTLLRLNKNFGWTYHLVELLADIIKLLQEPRPAPSCDEVERRKGRQPIENPGPPAERPQHPTSKEILGAVLPAGENIWPEKKP